MLQVGLDIPTEGIPEFVIEHLVTEMDMSCVHLSGLGFADLEPSARDEGIRSVSNSIGNLALSNEDPDSDIWLLDSKTSPNAQQVPGHTDNAHKGRPEEIVAFWNIRSSSDGGENVITPLAKIMELAERSKKVAGLVVRAATKEIVFASGPESTKGRVIDWHDKTIRYDSKSISPEDDEFKPLFAEAIKVGTVIKLEPGEVLFFNNRTSVHARLPYSDPDRLSIRTRMLV